MASFYQKINNSLKKALLFAAIFFSQTIFAQSVVGNSIKATASTKEFVISYSISINGAKKSSIQQTYNGSLKTIFVKNNLVRIRLVSLMRFQSLYFNNKPGVVKNIATLVKESGKDKSILSLSAAQWKQFNKRNDSMRCEIFNDDSLLVLDKVCKKAILTSTDSSKVTVYFWPNTKSNILANAEPIFKQVPGLVLRYIVEANKKSIDYTAVDMRFEKISDKVFTIPTKGFKKLKYNPNGTTTIVTADEDEEEGTSTEEDDEMDAAPAIIAAPPVKP
jgi:hypothetical protein